MGMSSTSVVLADQVEQQSRTSRSREKHAARPANVESRALVHGSPRNKAAAWWRIRRSCSSMWDAAESFATRSKSNLPLTLAEDRHVSRNEYRQNRGSIQPPTNIQSADAVTACFPFRSGSCLPSSRREYILGSESSSRISLPGILDRRLNGALSGGTETGSKPTWPVRPIRHRPLSVQSIAAKRFCR